MTTNPKKIIEELGIGLAHVAFYFTTSLGVPFEIFEECLVRRCPNGADKLFFYLKFKEQHPELSLPDISR